MTRASLVRFVSLGFIWGSSYTFIKIALDGFTPGQLVLARLALGVVFLLSIITASKISLPRFGVVWAHIAVTSVFGMVAPFLFLAWGEQRVSAAMAGVIIAALPLVTLGLATAALPSERATLRRTSGLIVGFMGVVLVLSPWVGSVGSLPGQLLILAAACCYGIQTVYIRKFLSPRGLKPLALAATQLIIATVLQAAITPFFAWETPTVTWSTGFAVVTLGFLATGAAYVLYFRLIGDLGATTASAVNYIVPIVAMLFSVITLQDRITWNMLVGVLLVMLGLAIAENRFDTAKWQRRRAPEAAAPDAVKLAAAKPAGGEE